MPSARTSASRFYQAGLDALDAGRNADAIAALEKALAADPHDPATLFALGEAASRIGLHQTAARFFGETLRLAPERHEAAIRLARALGALARHDEAIEHLRAALARAPLQASLWLALANVVRELGDLENASTFYQEALRLNPDSGEACGNLADLAFDAGDVARALELYDAALARLPGSAQLRLNRALALLANGAVEEGWRDYESRLDIPGRVIERRGAPPRWDGSPRGGARLLVMAEQGVGDQIAFAAFIPQLLEDGPVILECEPRLQPLLARSFPQATVRGAPVKAEGAALHADYGWLADAGGADLSIELCSLPHLCGGRPAAALPWLKPDPAERARWQTWRESLGPRPAIGVSWRSGLKGGLRDAQYAPLADWGAFIARLDATPVVAQYAATPEEIAALEEISGRKIAVPPGLDQKIEIDRTAAMISTLDGIVTAPTAVASIAAALGAPTWKVLYYRSWTSLGEEREPFLPAAVCVTPETAGQWPAVFDAVLNRLGRI